MAFVKESNNVKNPVKNILGALFKKKEEGYHIYLLFFSIIVTISLFAEACTPSLHSISRHINLGMSTLFIADFFWRLYKSPDKKMFLKYDWLDFFLAIPFFGAWHVVALLARCLKEILEFVFKHMKSAFASMGIIGVSLATFSSISILQFEVAPESNIKNIFDALWWSLCTITTVGYGDKFPITWQGRVIAAIQMIAGIGLFGVLVGYVGSFFVDKEKSSNKKVDTIEDLSGQIEELKKIISEQKEK